MIKEINSTEAYSILQKSENAVLIDVRSTMEHEYVGHPVNAIHVPIKEPPGWEIRVDFINNVKSEEIKGKVMNKKDKLKALRRRRK